MAAFMLQHQITLNKKGARYFTDDGTWRVICTISKRYEKGRPPYWYGYSKEWREFLSEGEHAFIVLGGVDIAVGFAIPRDEIKNIIGELYKTPGRHSHIVLEVNDNGGLDLSIPNGKRISLTKYEFAQAAA
jgi:hypothetical protein